MKHLKTLITLFLLVIGTSVSADNISVPARTGGWNWKDATAGSTIVAQTNIVGTTGTIQAVMTSEDTESFELEVDATDGSFTFHESEDGNYAVLTAGCKIRVPVRRMGDRVTVKCTADGFNYTINGITARGSEWTSSAMLSNQVSGYIEIVATGTEACFYEINVEQRQFSSLLPTISLNCEGWASYTPLLKGYVVALPSTATAYVATSVDISDGEHGTVTLTKVKYFGYGEGVFIYGADYDELYATVVDNESDVPKIQHNLTIGCTKDTQISRADHAYVVATMGWDEEAGFYHVSGTSPVTIPAGKAYFTAASANGAKSLSIVFEDGEEATGIESILPGVVTEAPTVLYNLSGQRVGKNYKGIVVGNNGRKYLK